MNKCPRCDSEKIRIVNYMGTNVRICKDCGYDEREELDTVPEERNTQREKRKFTPYRSGRKKQR